MNTCMPIETIRFTACLLSAAMAVACSPLKAAPLSLSGAERPNVILCMADDLGWGDTGYNGHPTLKTPNLDAMAQAGLRFNRFYSAAPVCSPTRGSVLTGRHPSRYGVPTANAGHLKKEEICLAQVLKQCGYATGHFGKWHLGTMAPDFSGKGKGRKPAENYMTPGMSGFDEWFSTEYAVATWDPYDPQNAHGLSDPRTLYWQNGRNIVDGDAAGLTGCDSRIIMDKALPFLRKSIDNGKPFFAVIWFHAPHAPVVGGPNYRAMYPDRSEDEQHYFATITALDEQIGRLRSKLREWNVSDNTMLWFCSDNGPEGTNDKRGRFQGSAGPFRGRKRSLYEGGVRVPGLLEWPAKVAGNQSTDVAAVTSDYFPTILDIVGYKIPTASNRPCDGMSLVPVIEGKLAARPHPIGFQTRGMATLTDNRYKLVHRTRGNGPGKSKKKEESESWELYDLVSDPAESNDLAADHPDVVERMRGQLQQWQASCLASSQGADYQSR